MFQDTHPLFSFALVLTSGLAGGEVVARLGIPRVTGWIMTGIGLAAVEAPGITAERVEGLRPFNDFVLGYIAFMVGSHLNLQRLRGAGLRLSMIVLTEALVTPVVVALAVHYLAGLSWMASLLLGAVAVAGAPGTTLTVVKEIHARGIFVKTLLAALALIDMVAVCTFEVVHAVLAARAANASAGIPDLLQKVVVVLGQSGGIGLAAALFVIAYTRNVVGREKIGITLVAAILLTWGVAATLGVSGILACTFLGTALANLIADKEDQGEAYLLTFESLLFTVFYTLAGIRLDFGRVLPYAVPVGIFFFARLVGKTLSASLAMTLAGSVESVRRWLGPALLPHGGVAVGLILFILGDPSLAAAHETVLAVGLSALAVNQLVGPSLTRYSVQKAGEAGMDRARLIDFIHEEHITTKLEAATKEEAIEKLVDLLLATHALPGVDRDSLLKTVLDREAEQSTCLGSGLMIPHGVLDARGTGMVGVMALSRTGFEFDAPDDLPVHCIVLLATPAEDQERHLAVLAALARAIGADRNIQRELYHARSPAHAYQILHDEEAADFNYFLDED